MLILKILAIIGLTILSGWLYRKGGQKDWNKKWRQIGVSSCAILTMLVLGMQMLWWQWIATFGMMFGFLTTYFKFGGQEDVYWYNWLITGFMYGLSTIFYALQSGYWLGFGIRTGILAIGTMLWSEHHDDVEKEERGRGWGFTGSIPLLLIR